MGNIWDSFRYVMLGNCNMFCILISFDFIFQDDFNSVEIISNQTLWNLWDKCLSRGMVLSEIDHECHYLATRVVRI